MKQEEKDKMLEFLRVLKGMKKPYTKEFFMEVQEDIKKEYERYEETCRRLKIDPESGKSTMSWEERNRRFTI